MKARELAPEQKGLELLIKVEEKTETREVTSSSDDKFHRVCEALVGDETGCVYLSLWDERIDELKEREYYKISKAYTTVYKHSLRLNIGRYGKIQEAEGTFEIDTSNNLSLKEL